MKKTNTIIVSSLPTIIEEKEKEKEKEKEDDDIDIISLNT